ncbi:family 16 glycosylhydrolase [Cryptosporangium sp. NPDC051539]|uniref:glycoside hydrolase family 16 protein n=1 Tax=Cryptosporangium sp. NPDC051539 TaxID=3363962 RepID=UPI0037915BCB
MSRWMLIVVMAMLAVAPASAPAAGVAAARPAEAEPDGIVLEGLTVPDSAEDGQGVSASARLRATSESVAVDSVTVAVRDSEGRHFDFPGARAATIPRAGLTVTTGTRTFPAGDYRLLVAVKTGGRWTGLTPYRYLTVRSNPVTFRQDFSGPAGAGPNYGLSTAMWFGTEQARLDGLGHLALSAGRLSMLDTAGNDGAAAWAQQGGHFEIRMAAPDASGVRAVFRTIGADTAGSGRAAAGTVDVAEIRGDQPGLVRQYAHGGTPDLAFGTPSTLPAGRVTGWHVYALDWRSAPDGYLKWSVDGVATQELTAERAGSSWTSFRRPHALELETDGGTLLVDRIGVTRYPAG